ncbi:glycosyl transferase, group I [Candidatus Vecturithrix granuli]|uniref:Glycosyl transferase, group I n=1 Tax=Vecturithrix granuli TaxID=1499967 RepID=A0A081C4B4_VECG1|nr:glycosyl transferase, group I [Candidatus Vecturithrix granuli]
MNILFLSQRVPFPPKKGDKLRSFNEIKFLARTHQIFLACLTDNQEDFHYEDKLKAYCQSVDIVLHSSLRSNIQALCSICSSKPLTLGYFYSKQLYTIIKHRLEEQQIDLIFVYCSSMAQYVEHIQHIPKVIDFVDIDSEKWHQYTRYARFPQKFIYRLESQRLRTYEIFLANTFQHCFLVSEKEVADFQKLVCPCSRMTPILNGVDTEMFHPSSEPYDPTAIVFTGAMDYWANVETVRYFCHEILPRIQRAIPEVKFYIVGRDPSPEVQALGKNQTNIIVTGSVEHIQPYVLKSVVFIAPMRIARGVQNKILEAMAMGVPVVTNSLGFEGIIAEPGQSVLVEDQPDQFAEQVIRLMNDPSLRNTLAQNAREVIEKYYNWDTNLEKLEHILAEFTH